MLWKSGFGMKPDEALSEMEEGPPRSACREDFKPVRAARVKSPGGERWKKRRRKLRQVRSEETNVSKPLMTCRNMFYRRRNRDQDVYPASKGWGGAC